MTELLESARKPHADCVIPLLYLGNLAIARNKKSLEELRIRAVCVSASPPPPHPTPAPTSFSSLPPFPRRPSPSPFVL